MAMDPKAGKRELEIKPHTEAKHNILKMYLGIWVTILGSRYKKLAYIDGFAGPGIYKGGEPGSPIIALNAASKAKHKRTPPFVHFWFIEKDKKHAASLCNEITNTMDELSDHVIIHGVKKTEFELGFRDIIDKLSQPREIPAFASVDPFGYSAVKMDTLLSFLKAPKREILVTFMVGFLNRFTTLEKTHDKLDEVFGTSEWKNYGKRTGKEKIDYLLEVYVDQFEKRGFKCLEFKMYDQLNKLIYSLIFVTAHKDGLRVMKDAMSPAMSPVMSRTDDRSQFTFSDAVHPNQTSLLQHGGMGDAYAAGKIYEEFHGRQFVPVGEIKQFIDQHIRRPSHSNALQILEDANPPKITGVDTLGKRRKHTYPDGCRISFSNKQ